MPLLLEVIVQSVADARAAAAGGADRLEVVREIDRDGLTPSLDLVTAITSETDLPLRVMVRESEGFSIAGRHELARLQKALAAFGEVGVDGVVLGFVRAGQIDVETTNAVVSSFPTVPVTFHRAFDAVNDPAAAIQTLRTVRQVDRILTDGGSGDWQARCLRFEHYATLAGSQLTILAGGGIDAAALRVLASCAYVREVHIGRAARDPQLRSAPVSAERVRSLKALAH